MTELFQWLLDLARQLPRPAQVTAALIVLAFVGSRLSRFLIRQVIRRIALVSLTSDSTTSWRTRGGRYGDETREVREYRRRQRIDAATRMVNHLASVAIWIVATIVGFHLLDIDPTFYLSGAGFLGAGFAIGGQHKVHDYLTGLSVHFEDRYGVGDTIMVDVGWSSPVAAVVEHIGLFSTRLNDGHSTYHFPNGQMVNVENRSQEAALSTLRVKVPDHVDSQTVSSVVRDLAGCDGLTDILLVGDVEAYQPSTGEVAVEVRTPQHLDARQRHRLERRAERRLSAD